MPVPKQRHTKSRRDKRRQHLKLKHQTLSTCPKCNNPVLPHRVCLNCGYYKGKEEVNVLSKLEKKERKQKEKEMERSKKAKDEESPRSQEVIPSKRPLSIKDLSKKQKIP